LSYANLDRIEITVEDIKKLMEWKNKNKDLVRNRKDVLKEGFICYDDTSIYFKRTLIHMEYKMFYAKGKILSFKHNALTYVISDVWKDSSFKLNDYERQEMIKDIITVHASLMAYMEHYNPQVEVKVIQTSKESKKSNKTKKVKNTKRVVNLTKQYKVNIVDKPTPTPHGYHERHTIAWRVRGHWRKYKSGKTVWVNSYTKGNIEDVQGKIYKI
jgi:hypothetical protein